MPLTLRSALARVAKLGLGLALGAWLVLLRPTILGGTTTYVFVGGESMVPTFGIGDLVIVQPAAAYPPGAVVAYRIPAGEPGAGRLVIHRVVTTASASGFTTQGDHNGYTDVWHPQPTDILGSPVAVLPRVGLAIQLLRQPVVAASLAALLVMSLVWRPGRRGPGSVPAPGDPLSGPANGPPGPAIAVRPTS